MKFCVSKHFGNGNTFYTLNFIAKKRQVFRVVIPIWREKKRKSPKPRYSRKYGFLKDFKEEKKTDYCCRYSKTKVLSILLASKHIYLYSSFCESGLLS